LESKRSMESTMTEQHAAAGSSPLEWLTSRRALRAAKAALPTDGSRSLELRRRARLACELSDRLCDPVEPLREGAATPLAIDLYRQSSYWVLCALNHDGALYAEARAHLPVGRDRSIRRHELCGRRLWIFAIVDVHVGVAGASECSQLRRDVTFNEGHGVDLGADVAGAVRVGEAAN